MGDDSSNYSKQPRLLPCTELAAEWAKKYGPMTYISHMGQRMLFLNTTDITRRLLASEDYKLLVADRAGSTPTKIGSYNGKDWVFTSYDTAMRKKRRMFHSAIGHYGDGIEKFENVVSGEMDRLLTELEQFENEDVDLWKYLARSLKIIIYILTVGEQPDDITKMDILEEYDIAFNKLWLPEYDTVLSIFPFLAKFPGKFKNAVDRLLTAKAGAEELVYFAPKRTWIPGKPRGIADYVFDLQNKPGYEYMKDDPEHAIAFLTTLFWAAHLTSRASVLGVFLCLINYPEVAKKLHQEIDQVIGDRRPKLEDKPNMPYTEATIFEALRLITQVPLGGLRIVSQDIQVDDVTIPKGTMLLINSWYFHHNEEIWEDPWAFKPERFLNDQGQLLPADHPVRKNVLPFGAGTRSCPGEIFAKSRVFMFLTNILQKYDVIPPANEKLVPADFRSNHDAVKGFIRQVQPFKCRLQRRHARIK
ncbi:unnamed protein product [Candidula unifasciata]|uniref:Cytochrome P450 n=1 Tax=Candidula unifasciata TaxID=100452 RepID=A0A8S3ZM76_9EUPU|nr:unnamed protein product [Candidula unifasciata]